MPAKQDNKSAASEPAQPVALYHARHKPVWYAPWQVGVSWFAEACDAALADTKFPPAPSHKPAAQVNVLISMWTAFGEDPRWRELVQVDEKPPGRPSKAPLAYAKTLVEAMPDPSSDLPRLDEFVFRSEEEARDNGFAVPDQKSKDKAGTSNKPGGKNETNKRGKGKDTAKSETNKRDTDKPDASKPSTSKPAGQTSPNRAPGVDEPDSQATTVTETQTDEPEPKRARRIDFDAARSSATAAKQVDTTVAAATATAAPAKATRQATPTSPEPEEQLSLGDDDDEEEEDEAVSDGQIPEQVTDPAAAKSQAEYTADPPTGQPSGQPAAPLTSGRVSTGRFPGQAGDQALANPSTSLVHLDLPRVNTTAPPDMADFVSKVTAAMNDTVRTHVQALQKQLTDHASKTLQPMERLQDRITKLESTLSKDIVELKKQNRDLLQRVTGYKQTLDNISTHMKVETTALHEDLHDQRRALCDVHAAVQQPITFELPRRALPVLSASPPARPAQRTPIPAPLPSAPAHRTTPTPQDLRYAQRSGQKSKRPNK